MARYLGSKCKLCRREGVKLFLKGARCDSPKCALFRKQQVPGQHGTNRRRRRPSEYSLQLREKQKVKRTYGVREAQFKNYFAAASKSREDVGDVLLQTLERRLDNVVYRAGLAHSRSHARQMVGHRKVTVGGKIVDRASFLVGVDDTIGLTSGGEEEQWEILRMDAVPPWLVRDEKKKEISLDRLPERDDLGLDINEHLIVEFYSR